MGAGEGALLPLCLLALLVLPGTRPVTDPVQEEEPLNRGLSPSPPSVTRDWEKILQPRAQSCAGLLERQDTYVELDFFQESFPSEQKSGEFLQEFNEEETFHVDWSKKETVWRLPNFTTFTSFETQGALGNLAVMKTNMEILMKRSNRTQDQDVAPSSKLYTKNPVEMGEPNVLICFVDQFSPPVLNITWLKNGEEVSEGVQETDFYPSKDITFRKFSYLTFIPEAGDFYVCKVDHWGLAESLSKIWYCKEPPHLPETLENVVCALGLALGILGIVAGTVLCLKARQGGEGNRRRGIR